MKFTGVLRAPRIDIAAYRQEVGKVLMESLKDAAVEWLSVTAGTIPQWSGASVATFIHLARAAGLSVQATPTGASNVPNRINLGLGHSEGGFNIDAINGKYSFFYSTSLPHLIWNEYNDANSNPDPTLFSKLIDPGPYNFQERGKLAFMRMAAGVRLPDPKFKITTIGIG